MRKGESIAQMVFSNIDTVVSTVKIFMVISPEKQAIKIEMKFIMP